MQLRHRNQVRHKNIFDCIQHDNTFTRIKFEVICWANNNLILNVMQYFCDQHHKNYLLLKCKGRTEGGIAPAVPRLLADPIEFIQRFFHFERLLTVQRIEINQNYCRQKQA